MNNGQSVLRYRPTTIEVEKLLSHFRQMKEGDIAEHATLAALVDVAPEDPRYRITLLAKARKVFGEETGVVLETVWRQGIRYPSGADQIKNGVRKLRGAAKGMVRSTRIVAAVSDERVSDPNARAIRDHVVQRMTYLVELVRGERHALEARVGTPEVAPQMALPA